MRHFLKVYFLHHFIFYLRINFDIFSVFKRILLTLLTSYTYWRSCSAGRVSQKQMKQPLNFHWSCRSTLCGKHVQLLRRSLGAIISYFHKGIFIIMTKILINWSTTVLYRNKLHLVLFQNEGFLTRIYPTSIIPTPSSRFSQRASTIYHLPLTTYHLPLIK